MRSDGTSGTEETGGRERSSRRSLGAASELVNKVVWVNHSQRFSPLPWSKSGQSIRWIPSPISLLTFTSSYTGTKLTPLSASLYEIFPNSPISSASELEPFLLRNSERRLLPIPRVWAWRSPSKKSRFRLLLLGFFGNVNSFAELISQFPQLTEPLHSGAYRIGPVGFDLEELRLFVNSSDPDVLVSVFASFIERPHLIPITFFYFPFHCDSRGGARITRVHTQHTLNQIQMNLTPRMIKYVVEYFILSVLFYLLELFFLFI